MTAHTQPDAAQKIHALIQSLQQDDRLGAMEQLVVLSLQLGTPSGPLSAPGLQTIPQETVKAVVRELNGVIERQRDIAIRLAAEDCGSAWKCDPLSGVSALKFDPLVS